MALQSPPAIASFIPDPCFLCLLNEILITMWWLQTPAPARHERSQGIKLDCITWVGSTEANNPNHAWCYNTENASHASWTLKVMLIFCAQICIIQHRSALLFVLANRYELKISKCCASNVSVNVNILSGYILYTAHLSNPKTNSALKCICPASFQHLSHLGSHMKSRKWDSKKTDIRNRNTHYRNVSFLCARRAA